MKKAIAIIILGLLLSGCSGSIKPTMISGDFISTEHGTARTVDVMKGAQEYCELRNKKAKLFFLIGADNLVKFHKWKNWNQIPNLAKIGIFPRLNYSMNSLSSIAAKKLSKKDLVYINSKKINISSSLIRRFW